jgi:hypothetical protein
MAYLIAGHGIDRSSRLPLLLHQKYAYTDDVSPRIATTGELLL